MKTDDAGSWIPASVPAGPLRSRAPWVPLGGILLATFFVSWPRVAVPVDDRWYYIAAFPLGLAIGATWQLLGRRDLVDRLLYPTLAAVLAIPIFLLLPVNGLTLVPSLGELLFGILAGLVISESWLRRRDRRAAVALVTADPTPVAEPDNH